MSSSSIHVLAVIERVLMVAVVLLTLYAVFLFRQEKVDRSAHVSMANAESSVNALLSPDKMVPLKPISAYAEQLVQRDIFSFSSAPAEKSPNDAPAAGAWPANLKIVGVMIGANPSEVIIEDAQTQQTYFLKEGETSGVFKVLHISKTSVAIEYQGQSFEVGLQQ
jgi:type II secretory pathway component PulC